MPKSRRAECRFKRCLVSAQMQHGMLSGYKMTQKKMESQGFMFSSELPLSSWVQRDVFCFFYRDACLDTPVGDRDLAPTALAVVQRERYL